MCEQNKTKYSNEFRFTALCKTNFFLWFLQGYTHTLIYFRHRGIPLKRKNCAKDLSILFLIVFVSFTSDYSCVLFRKVVGKLDNHRTYEVMFLLVCHETFAGLIFFMLFNRNFLRILLILVIMLHGKDTSQSSLLTYLTDCFQSGT